MVAKPAAATTRPAATPGVQGIGGAQNAQWLMQRAANEFTLQLVTLSSTERVAALLAKQRQPDQFAVFQKASNGRVLHVVTYGVYASRAAAEQASRRLPAELQGIKPWVRSISGIQTAIRTTLQVPG